MRFAYDDGGRAAAGYRGKAGDCVTRSIAIATGKPYQEVYDDLHAEIKRSKLHRERGRSPRNGVLKRVWKRYLMGLGWQWVSCMEIGSGCTVHLRADELPKGPLVVQVSKHLCAVIDGEIRDTHDPSRDGTRCVYGYWIGP